MSSETQQATPGAGARLAMAVVNLPRGVRILIAIVFSLASALLATPVVFGRPFSSPNDPLLLYTLIVVVIGYAVYFIGWRLIVGFAGENPPPRIAILFYLVLGGVVVFIALFQVIAGAINVALG
ncbi:MAG: hypothetical protein HC828_14585 [Blastochloris sp.]|nr:hypothetical protein [Blastochloris sp.]